MGQLGGGLLKFCVVKEFFHEPTIFLRECKVLQDVHSLEWQTTVPVHVGYTTAIRNMMLTSYLPFTYTFLPGGKVEILSILISSRCVIYLRRKSTFLLLIGEMRGTYSPLFYLGKGVPIGKTLNIEPLFSFIWSRGTEINWRFLGLTMHQKRLMVRQAYSEPSATAYRNSPLPNVYPPA